MLSVTEFIALFFSPVDYQRCSFLKSSNYGPQDNFNLKQKLYIHLVPVLVAKLYVS